MKNVIHIYGASGSGTSTLGRKISEELGYRFMDTDDYFWLPTYPQYTTKRTKEERLALMKRDISENDNVVISGSLVDWGDELIPLFTLVIRGDMYTHHMEFIEWARKYDTGSIDMRSKAKHDEWQKMLLCKQIVLDGADALEENFKRVQVEINSVIGRMVTVTVDRPLGSFHPEHKDMYYPVNYGYVEGVMAQDGEEQDAYILGVDEAVEKFTGKIVAIVHRHDDIEEKWIVAPEGVSFTRKQIKEQIHFQEQYFVSEILM